MQHYIGRLTAPTITAASSLVASLNQLDRGAALALAPALVPLGVQFPVAAAVNYPASLPLDTARSLARPVDANIALTQLAQQTLSRAIVRFGPVKAKINSRLWYARLLSRGSALLTAALSSSVVGNLQLSGQATWTTILGLLTLLASLLTLAASWGGDAKFADEFGEVSERCEKAVGLRDRLLLYENDPALFPDWQDRLKEADELSTYLLSKMARWNV